MHTVAGVPRQLLRQWAHLWRRAKWIVREDSRHWRIPTYGWFVYSSLFHSWRLQKWKWSNLSIKVTNGSTFRNVFPNLPQSLQFWYFSNVCHHHHLIWGMCNNMDHPFWGKSTILMRRCYQIFPNFLSTNGGSSLTFLSLEWWPQPTLMTFPGPVQCMQGSLTTMMLTSSSW